MEISYIDYTPSATLSTKKRVVAYSKVMGVTYLNRTGSKRNTVTNVLVMADDNGIFVEKSSKTRDAPELTILPQVKD